MRKHPQTVLLALTLFLLSNTGSWAWAGSDLASDKNKTSSFTSRDRDLIHEYYLDLVLTLTPGAPEYSAFSAAVDKALVVGFRMPMQLQRVLLPLPDKLEGGLSNLNDDYKRCKLGRHVLVVKKADLTITDILKNVGFKD